MAYFSPVLISGETFHFTHLEPFSFIVSSSRAKKDLRVRVTYSNHCFTEKYDSVSHIEGEPIFDEDTARPRSFCRIRYRLSHSLPQLIQSFNSPKTKVWETAEERNWCYSITISDPAGPYHIFFEIKRASKDQSKFQELNLVVESAYYEKPEYGPPILKGSMAFQLLCAKVYLHERTSTSR